MLFLYRVFNCPGSRCVSAVGGAVSKGVMPMGEDRLNVALELDRLIHLYDGGEEASTSLARNLYELKRAARGIVRSAQIAKTGGKLTATTFGHEIKAPFGRFTLVDDEPRRGRLIVPDFELVSPFKGDETYIERDELVRRARYEAEFAGCDEVGDRDLDDMWEQRAQISLAEWPVGICGIAVATVWESPDREVLFKYLSRNTPTIWDLDYWSPKGVHMPFRLIRRKA